ncbi:MAG: hypothetical protein CL695_00185, partial [Chloroflexi bacterium]|nr:hypothetical protein [Chloroflexota bacterium]
KAELKVDLIMLLADNGYPPVNKDEVYKEIFEQAENFKMYQNISIYLLIPLSFPLIKYYLF